MIEPELRIAGVEDLDELIPFVRAYHEFEQVEQTDLERADTLRTLLADHSLGLVWLILAEGRVVGYIAICFGYSIEFMGKDAFVDEFFIHEAWRHRGIGQATLRVVNQQVVGMGVKALHLEVARDNPRAKAVYRALGFDDREQFQMMSIEL